MATPGPAAPPAGDCAEPGVAPADHDLAEPAGWSLCGIMPATTPAQHLELPPGARFVPYRQIAGLTRPAPATPAHRLRSSLLSYTDLLDQLAATGPLLPIRFGTTLPSAAAVINQVLAPHHHTFVRALAALGSQAQFTVRARYLTDALVAEVLAQRPDLARLQRYATGQAARLRFGELISQAVAGKRALDSNELVGRLRPYAAAVTLQPATTMDIESLADVACLVDRDRWDPFAAAVAEIGKHWHGRARLRLLGPMAAYHFADWLAGTGR